MEEGRRFVTWQEIKEAAVETCHRPIRDFKNTLDYLFFNGPIHKEVLNLRKSLQKYYEENHNLKSWDEFEQERIAYFEAAWEKHKPSYYEELDEEIKEFDIMHINELVSKFPKFYTPSNLQQRMSYDTKVTDLKRLIDKLAEEEFAKPWKQKVWECIKGLKIFKPKRVEDAIIGEEKEEPKDNLESKLFTALREFQDNAGSAKAHMPEMLYCASFELMTYDDIVEGTNIVLGPSRSTSGKPTDYFPERRTILARAQSALRDYAISAKNTAWDLTRCLTIVGTGLLIGLGAYLYNQIEENSKNVKLKYAQTFFANEARLFDDYGFRHDALKKSNYNMHKKFDKTFYKSAFNIWNEYLFMMSKPVVEDLIQKTEEISSKNTQNEEGEEIHENIFINLKITKKNFWKLWNYKKTVQKSELSEVAKEDLRRLLGYMHQSMYSIYYEETKDTGITTSPELLIYSTIDPKKFEWKKLLKLVVNDFHFIPELRKYTTEEYTPEKLKIFSKNLNPFVDKNTEIEDKPFNETISFYESAREAGFIIINPEALSTIRYGHEFENQIGSLRSEVKLPLLINLDPKVSLEGEKAIVGQVTNWQKVLSASKNVKNMKIDEVKNESFRDRINNFEIKYKALFLRKYPILGKLKNYESLKYPFIELYAPEISTDCTMYKGREFKICSLELVIINNAYQIQYSNLENLHKFLKTDLMKYNIFGNVNDLRKVEKLISLHYKNNESILDSLMITLPESQDDIENYSEKVHLLTEKFEKSIGKIQKYSRPEVSMVNYEQDTKVILFNIKSEKLKNFYTIRSPIAIKN